jgi:hypothetical protein
MSVFQQKNCNRVIVTKLVSNDRDILDIALVFRCSIVTNYGQTFMVLEVEWESDGQTVHERVRVRKTEPIDILMTVVNPEEVDSASIKGFAGSSRLLSLRLKQQSCSARRCLGVSPE